MSEPLPPVAGVIKVTISSIGGDNRKAENVFFWSYTGGPPTVSNAEAIASDIWTAWSENFTSLTNSELLLTSVTVLDLSSDLGAEAVFTNSDTPVPGTLEGTPLPLSSAMLINKDIARHYRGGHPRSYLAVGTAPSLVNDGTFTSDFVGDVGSAYGFFSTGVNEISEGSTSLTAEVCVSYYSVVVEPTPPHRRTTPLVQLITATSPQAQLATQRRRVRRTSRHR